MNVFDIIGPIMIGPSSSHTAGAVRLGLIASMLLKERPIEADIVLSGSFAETGQGHGTDKALVAGILGMQPDNDRIKKSLDLAKEEGLAVSFHKESIPGAHPNTARISLVGEQGASVVICGASVGGGNINITSINELQVSITGQYSTILVFHENKPGIIAAVTDLVARQGINIGSFFLARSEKGQEAIMTIEVDGNIPAHLGECMETLPHVDKVITIPAIGGGQ